MNNEQAKTNNHASEKLPPATLSTFQSRVCQSLGSYVIPRNLPPTLIDDKPSATVNSHHFNIKTTKQFLDWYSQISDEWLDSDNEKYNHRLEELVCTRNKCNDILKKIDDVEHQFDKLKSDYKAVSDKTTPLYLASQRLSQDQKQLNTVLDAANERLHPYRKIENIIKRLESSSIAVTSDRFLEILNDIDKCIEYFTEHDRYKESGAYLIKSRHILSRALVDVKSYIMGVLETCRSVPSTVSLLTVTSNLEESSNIDVRKGSKFMAQYGRFQNIAVRLKPLLLQLENRAEKSIEYESALNECVSYYIITRHTIIVPSLQDTVNQFVVAHNQHYCSLLRSISTELVHLCQDEDKLYYSFFTNPSTLFRDFLEARCAVLYNTMRPLIIQLKHIETLAEFCSILKVGILQEQIQDTASLQPLSNVVEQLLKDVQERLVFRSHIYFQNDILQFAPSPGDLAYPEKLEMMKRIAEEIRNQENAAALSRYNSQSSLPSLVSCGHDSSSKSSTSRISKNTTINTSPADLHGMWYPAIRRTLVCLSHLYRCVEKPVFQGLAQEAIACCCENIQKATQIIHKTKSELDGQLFLIKHMLILREQIAPFQVDFTVTEMSIDFNNLKSAANGLLQRNKLFSLSSNNAILELILHGTPSLRENCLDSRKIVDQQLKSTCEVFISHSTDMIVSKIKTFLSQVTEHESSGKTTPLSQEKFAKAETVLEIVRETVKKIKSNVAMLLHKMDLYLANQDTQFILYRPIKNNIMGTIAKLYTVIEDNYSTDEQMLIGCPTAEQTSILLSSVILSGKFGTSS